MLQQIISNTYTCDGLNCPTAPITTDNNPFTHLIIRGSPNSDLIEIDLCDVCVETITAPIVVDYIASLPKILP